MEYFRDHTDATFCSALGSFIYDLCSFLLQNVTHIVLYSGRAVLAGIYDIEDVDRCLVFGGYLESIVENSFCWLAPICGK